MGDSCIKGIKSYLPERPASKALFGGHCPALIQPAELPVPSERDMLSLSPRHRVSCLERDVRVVVTVHVAHAITGDIQLSAQVRIEDR